MFHYPSQLSHLWGRGPRALPRNAVIRCVLPQIIAMSQVAAFCRKSPSATKKYLLFTVPTPPRRFHIYWRGLRANSRGSRPNISCPEGPPAFPYKVWGLYWIDRIEKHWPQEWARRQNSCPENPSAIPLYVERQFVSV